ncbi:MAG TPA: ADP-ribosylglycohydrolase family protein [Kofleriaceae bacterium]|nr:ADP-ribosylglycohydrolase family protein [Kofleriaceae bacterium]
MPDDSPASDARLRDGAAWREEAPRLFRGRGSFGNGAAMRAAPIGAFFAIVACRADRATLLETVVRYTPPGNVLARLERAARIPLHADPVQVGDALGTGFDIAAHDTVPFCLWVAARHLDSYEEAIWTATSQPGDRDTNGAIVGGIVVLATSVDRIPVLWRAATEPLPVP